MSTSTLPETTETEFAPPKHSIKVRVVDVEEVAAQIKRFTLRSEDGEKLPRFSAGSNITVIMPAGQRQFKNQYSLLSTPGDTDTYQIGVLQVEDSRGGSVFMHHHVEVDDVLWISYPNNQFPLVQKARRHLLIAGGIGVTPFMAMTRVLADAEADYELHYGVRAKSRAAFAEELSELCGSRFHLYSASEDQHIPYATLLAQQPLGTHLYVCGPGPMIEFVMEQARELGWPEDSLHWEKFIAPPAGEPFEVTLTESEKTVKVGADQSILEAVEAAGVQPDYGCRGGVCGRCETAVVRCRGTIEHNDDYLSKEERDSGEKIMICMSRFRGEELSLKL